jgi:hypothetical protein
MAGREEQAAAEPEGGDEQERKAFLLRLDPRLHAELRAWATQELRSLNAHIEWLLRDAVRRRRGGSRGPG